MCGHWNSHLRQNNQWLCSPVVYWGHLQIVKAANFKSLAAKLCVKKKIPSCKGFRVSATLVGSLLEMGPERQDLSVPQQHPLRAHFPAPPHTQYLFPVRGCLLWAIGRWEEILTKCLQDVGILPGPIRTHGEVGPETWREGRSACGGCQWLEGAPSPAAPQLPISPLPPTSLSPFPLPPSPLFCCPWMSSFPERPLAMHCKQSLQCLKGSSSPSPVPSQANVAKGAAFCLKAVLSLPSSNTGTG